MPRFVRRHGMGIHTCQLNTAAGRNIWSIEQFCLLLRDCCPPPTFDSSNHLDVVYNQFVDPNYEFTDLQSSA
jgi:hypothetical protein